MSSRRLKKTQILASEAVIQAHYPLEINQFWICFPICVKLKEKPFRVLEKLYFCSGSYHKDLCPSNRMQVKGFINFGFWFLKILASAGIFLFMGLDG
ncbi:MAG: hypothetical protein IJ622_03765 [Bacteroidales bacterium]|nr:hypothetical protein [Bacteroidales bacterium]